MFAYAAALSFAIAVLMHAFGWGSGKVDVTLFLLIGLLCVALHLCGFLAQRVWWRQGPRQAPPPQ